MKLPLPAVQVDNGIPTKINTTFTLPKECDAGLDLVAALCQGMAEADIPYCHWKSNNALDRSANGENDLDLLISREDAGRFTELLYRLEFKQAKAPAEKQIPGVVDYFGYDAPSGKLVHAHVHYQLTLGHDLSKNFRLPIEDAYIASAVQEGLFRVPAPEFEYIVLVIRLMLKHCTWDVMLCRDGRLKSAERKELAYLRERINPQRMAALLSEHLPSISKALFQDCVQALEPGCSIGKRIRAGGRLQVALQANARNGLLADIWLKFWRRAVLVVRHRVFRTFDKYRLHHGGITIALVGGDGAGKSTALETVSSWLGKYFELTRVHMGKPAWSPATIAIRGVLKAGQILGLYPVETSFRKTLLQQSPVSPGYPWMIREVCQASDRFRTYRQARRFAARDRIVLFDRFPLPQVQLMDGPQTGRFVAAMQNVDAPRGKNRFCPRPASRLARFLIAREQQYYAQMALPEIRVVLRLDPTVAVQRKPEEDPAFVYERNTEIFEQDWQSADVEVIDASQPREEVASQIKAIIWSKL